MLSRLWYLVLALAVGGALAGAFLNKSAASREAEFQLGEQLRRDHVEAELWQRLDARLRLDALASLAVDSEVRQTLRSSSGHSGTPGSSSRRRLSQKLTALNAKLEEGRGDLIFAVDTEGEIVATLDKNDAGTGRLDKMPLVQDALRGFMRDDVWVYNSEVYRMAARPVFDGGRYVGAIVHGMAIGDGLAKRLASKLPNATVVFFYRDRLIASHVGGPKAPSSAELKTGLDAALAKMKAGEGSVELTERTRVIASLVRGEAAHAQVGYLIGRRGSTVGLGGLFANTFKEDVASLPWLLVIGIPLLLLVLGLALLFFEHDKGLGILRKTSESVAKSELNSIPEGELRRQYRKVAENFNAALRAGVGFKQDAAKRASVDLDQLLTSTRDSKTASLFGGATDVPTSKRAAVESAPIERAPVESPVAKSPAMEPIQTVPAEAMPAAPPQGVPTEQPTLAATARPPRTASPRNKRSPSAWPNRASSSVHPVVATVRHGEDNPGSGLNDPPTRPNAVVDSYSGFEEEGEESTQVKHVPQELIEASAPAEQGEEIHFREVFDQFLETQKNCGASVSGLTFDKFVRKLHAARSQVMQRHNAAEVRFTVYVKEGRAALKASPVKA